MVNLIMASVKVPYEYSALYFSPEAQERKFPSLRQSRLGSFIVGEGISAFLPPSQRKVDKFQQIATRGDLGVRGRNGL